MFALQRTPEWHKERRGKLTASVAGAAIGVNPYQTPLALYKQLTGLVEFSGNFMTQYGTNNEPNGLLEYSIMSRTEVVPTGFHVHKTLPWLGGSPDGLVGDKGLVEVKCPFGNKKPMWEDYTIPLQYFVQVQVLMEVTDREWCDLIAWRPNEQGVWRFLRDRDFMQGILPAMANFHAAISMEETVNNMLDQGMIEHCRFAMQASMRTPPWVSGVKVKGGQPLYSELHL